MIENHGHLNLTIIIIKQLNTSKMIKEDKRPDYLSLSIFN